ncbi:MAG: spore coat U domain-containing protein [Sphingomonadaceae bacterium]|nr:spore coat U domain-containing protein [Sphingomonadaceae bacterium]
MKHIVRISSLGLALAAAMTAGSANAATATTTFTVNATVLKACVVSALPLAFGNYDPTSGSGVNGSTTLSVLCTNGTSFTTGLNAGTASGATVSTRRMSNGANTLSYGLYQDAARTTNWGNTAGTDTPAAQTAGVGATSLTVYGAIPASQNVPIGVYSDTITVTVTY